MQHAGVDTPLVTGLLRHAIAVAPTTPAMAAAEVWTVLRWVWFRDLQAFNKACRRELGAPPRAVRARAAHVR
jgi:hypothetical protein